MEQALEQLHACMESIPLPQYDGLDRKQKRLLIQDEEYQQLEETCVDLVEFVSPFVFEVRDAVAKMEEDDLTSRKVRKYLQLLKCLDYRAAYCVVFKVDDSDTNVGLHI